MKIETRTMELFALRLHRRIRAFASFAKTISLLRSGLFLVLLTPCAPCVAEDPPNLYPQILEAYQHGDFSKALSLAEKSIKAAPKKPQAWVVRAQIYDHLRQHAKAVSDYSEAIKLAPDNALFWQKRGEAHFRKGAIAESVSDFDQYLRLEPDQRPQHWQRGISLYYAGRFADGVRQFDIHQTVNPQDVENAVWRFLCMARTEGLEAARKSLLLVDKDTRTPMAEIRQLFAGKASAEEVLAAAKKGGESALFYADLYLGLYFEATGDSTKAREYILKAEGRAEAAGYMGDVARVHAERLRKGKRREETKPNEKRPAKPRKMG